MNRRKLIRDLQAKKRLIGFRLTGPKIDKKRILKDFCLFCNLEKEIEIQQAYVNHER